MDDFADLDRKIFELGHAIALNPENPNAGAQSGLAACPLWGAKQPSNSAVQRVR